MLLQNAYGYVKLRSGKKVDLNCMKRELKRLQHAVKSGDVIVSVDGEDNLGKEASVYLEVARAQLFTNEDLRKLNRLLSVGEISK